MKKIEINYYTFKEYDIYELIHPKLFGKYEIYKNEIFVSRELNLKNVKKKINKLQK